MLELIFQFAKYFELPSGDELVPAQIIRIEGKSNYKVSEFYFDDLMPLSAKSVSLTHYSSNASADPLYLEFSGE